MVAAAKKAVHGEKMSCFQGALGAVRVGDSGRFSVVLMAILGLVFWKNRGRIYSGIGRLGRIDPETPFLQKRLWSRFCNKNRRFCPSILGRRCCGSLHTVIL